MIFRRLKDLMQKRPSGAPAPSAEVERIAALQRAAVQRRVEYAAAQERAGAAPSGADALAPLRERVRQAEVAHATALQAWDNKQFRR